MIKKARKFFRILQAPGLRRGLRHGVAAAIEHAGFLQDHRFLTIVDAGANKGQFALAARHWQPEARIIAFEPLTEEAATFRALFALDSQVTLYSIALGASRGMSDIHISARTDSSSLLSIGALQNSYFPGTRETGTRSVEVRRLEDCISAEELAGSTLLKIDVQGFELELLKGADGLLSNITMIYVECSFVELYTGQALASEVINFLGKRGFTLSGIYNASYDELGKAVQADFAFERSSLA